MKAHNGLNTVTGGRIDNRHHFNQTSGWAQTDRALTIQPIGGPSLLDDYWQQVQLQARCYGDTPYQAGQVYKKLIDFTRQERRTVTVTEGKALINYIVPLAEARLILDEDARPEGGMPAYLVNLDTQISELTVT
jgi:hypothetical protein